MTGRNERGIMKIKKIVLVGAMAALLALGATALAGCGGKSDADVIRESLTQELDQVKNLDDAFLSEVTASAETGGLDQFGIDAKELMKAYFGGFDYRIDDEMCIRDRPIPVGAPRCPNCGGKAFKTVRLPDDPSIVNFVKKA